MNSRSELLRQAADLVTRVVKQLNSKSKRCKECGLTEYQNKKEFQAAKELEAVVKKLRRFEQEMKEK